ncbi:MAG: PEP-CTERM system TPR-repeat protein PrsT [Burkholderiaceae bacterium]|nr:PEP-CTERM system TPR-repeat protein PrsT [Burkholderiaceae bacterium]
MKYSTIRLVICLVLGTSILSACDRNDTTAMLASANGYIAKRDYKAAIIQLKNALQRTPDSPEVRFLLGKTLLDLGDVVSAGVELRKALDLKYPEDKVLPPLARTMLIQGQQDALLSEFGDKVLTDAVSVADLKTTIAMAHASRGKFAQADEALAVALAAAPDYLEAKLLQVRLLAAKNDFDGAMRLVDAILAKNPEATDAWQLKGDFLLHGRQNAGAAIEAYQKALSANSGNAGAHAGILSIHISKKDLAAAKAQLEQFKKVLPGHPQARYFEAVLAYESQDFKQAKELTLQLLKLTPDSPKVLQLAGLLELQAGSLLQAEVYLNKALQVSPGEVMARRLLVQTYLRAGQTAKALSTLQPLLEQSNPSAETLALAGEAQLQGGDSKKADTYFTRASKLNPNDTRSRTALALSQLARGNAEAALGELEQLASTDKGTTADMALISAHLRRGEVAAALKAVDALAAKQPDKALAPELKGRLLLAQKDPIAARKSFERALEIDPLYMPAVMSLAAMELKDNKPDDAKKRFDKLLTVDPKNVQALVAVAQLRAKAGASKEEISDLLANAIKLNPTEPAPRLLLIEHKIRSDEIKLALAAAQEAVSAIPQDPAILEVLGQVQQASGDLNQAISTFNKVIAMQPQLPDGYMRLAGAQLANKDPDGAAQSLKRALAIKPDYLPAQRSLIQLDLAAGRTKEAKAAVRAIQQQRSGETVGELYAGDVEAALKNWAEAANSYRAALDKGATSELAAKYHTVLLAAKKTKEADKFAADWMKDHPQDASFFYYLGDYALGRGDYPAAESYYMGVKRLKPDHAVALNNIAWLLAMQKKPGALAYAEQANKLQPDQPAFLDTLALILASENQLAKAIEAQKKAIALQPKHPGYRLSLAKIYIQSGQKPLARSELEYLSKLGDAVKEKAEAAQLLKAL